MFALGFKTQLVTYIIIEIHFMLRNLFITTQRGIVFYLLLRKSVLFGKTISYIYGSDSELLLEQESLLVSLLWKKYI